MTLNFLQILTQIENQVRANVKTLHFCCVPFNYDASCGERVTTLTISKIHKLCIRLMS